MALIVTRHLPNPHAAAAAMSRTLCLTVALAVSLSCVSPARGEDIPIKMFVGAPTRGGFVDTSKDVEDSIKDLIKRFRGAQGIALVDSPDKADVTVMIVARGVGSE